MKKYITEVILIPDFVKDPAIFSEGGIKIRVEDEAAGQFLVISSNDGTIPRIDFTELDAVFAACKELDNQ